jgi:hypothetical protein
MECEWVRRSLYLLFVHVRLSKPSISKYALAAVRMTSLPFRAASVSER